jgi:uncharacterized protein (UPF0276 family)
MVRDRTIPPTAGIGLHSPQHAREMQDSSCQWYEVVPERYFAHGGSHEELDRIAQQFPISMHCVGLSLGSMEPPAHTHLDALYELIGRYEPGLVSAHLVMIDAHLGSDLLPRPYTSQSLEVVVRNIDCLQSAIKTPIILENPARRPSSTPVQMTEAEFLTEIVRRTGCGVLLDINNIFVSSMNHDIDPFARLTDLLTWTPASAIRELHLGGHRLCKAGDGEVFFEADLGSRVSDEVWELFEVTVASLGPKPTLIEWNIDVLEFAELREEAQAAQWVLDGFVQVRDPT